MLVLVEDILLTGIFSELLLRDCLLVLFGLKVRNVRPIDCSVMIMIMKMMIVTVMIVMMFSWEEFHALYIHKKEPHAEVNDLAQPRVDICFWLRQRGARLARGSSSRSLVLTTEYG